MNSGSSSSHITLHEFQLRINKMGINYNQ